MKQLDSRPLHRGKVPPARPGQAGEIQGWWGEDDCMILSYRCCFPCRVGTPFTELPKRTNARSVTSNKLSESTIDKALYPVRAKVVAMGPNERMAVRVRCFGADQ